MLKSSYLWRSKIWVKEEFPTVLPLWKTSDVQLILWRKVDCFWLHQLKVTVLHSLSYSVYLTHACSHTNIFSYCLNIFCGTEQSQAPTQYISDDMTPFLRRIMLKCCYRSTLVASLGIWCSLITSFPWVPPSQSLYIWHLPNICHPHSTKHFSELLLLW